MRGFSSRTFIRMKESTEIEQTVEGQVLVRNGQIEGSIVGFKQFVGDLKQLIKLRLTITVVFSASVAFLIASKQQGDIHWLNWLILTLGGFLVTGSANGFNQIVERESDKLMKRTADRPLPSGRMNSGQALVLSLLMGIIGTYALVGLNIFAGVLSVFSILMYAFFYTPMKKKSVFAVLIGAFPGAFPPMIGYYAAFDQQALMIMMEQQPGIILVVPFVLFLIQFVWQFPHFWSLAWVLDEDYRRAGFRLLPTTRTDKGTALWILVTTILLVPVTLLPFYYGFGGYIVSGISLTASLYFSWHAFKLVRKLDVQHARKVMFISFFYLPLLQLGLLFDYIVI